MSYVITPEGHRANAIKQAADLRDKVLSIVDDANFSTSTARKITKKAAFSVVMRSLEESKCLPLSLREHLAMKELNSYIALAKHNKSDFFYAANADLLPISHPRSTREHSMTASALRISRSRWFAADPRITDEKAKAVLASAFESMPGSVEHLYYTSILLSLPQGIIPGDALIAATDGNSFESRSARARRQRRDRKGQFAYEGGGIRALIRRLNGEIFSVSGRVVANAKNSRDVEVEFPDGKIAQVNPAKGEYVKAVLPTPDGYSPKPIVPSASEEVINEKDLVFLDAPNGWVKDKTFKDFGDKVQRYVDSNKEFVVFASEKDDGTKDYQILNAKSAEQIDVVKTWADVQDRLEGKEDQLLDSKARLPKQQNAPVETKGGFQYNYPDNAYKIRQDSEYDVQGRVDEESPDFTDDPVELAQKQDERDLLAALEQAVSPGDDGENALGVGALPFGKGDEFVPAEAIFFALQEAGMDAPMELAKIYDKKLGNNANEKALNDFRKKEEVVSGNAPELAESFKKVTEQNPDLELPTEEPKFDAKEAESAPLPALLEGLSQKELEQFVETKDHIPYLPKNEEIEMPQGYNPLSPEPFAAWKEVTAENPDAVLPEGFSDNPVYLAQEIPTNDLLKELRRSVEPGNEVPGAAVIALPTEDGEDFIANVPGEAVRDALQLQGVDTNAEIKKIADEGFVGQKDEPVAELPLDAPAEEKPMNAYERLMAEKKAEAEAVEERVAKLKKDAEDRVDEQGRSVPEGWGFIAKNRPNFGQVDRPDNYFNVYGNNNFEASVDADGKITVKDRNGLLPDKSYDNWEDLQADLENQKSEYSAAARERVREIAKKYGYSDEQIAAFDSMSQQELADFFANPENHTQAYAEALDDLANSSAIDLPNAAQKQRWAQMRKDEKILAQAGDAPSEKAAFVGEYKPTADQIVELQKGVAELDWLDDGIMFLKPDDGGPRAEAPIEIYDDNGMAGDGPFAKIDVDGNFEWKDEQAYNKYADRLKEILDGGLEGIGDNQAAPEPQEIDNVPVEQEKLDDNKPAEDKTYVEENPEVIKVNAFVEANAGRLAPIKARDVKRGDFLWNNFNKVYEEILDIQPAPFNRVRFLIKDPRNQKEYFRFFERRSPIRNMRRPGTGEVSEGFKVAPEENRGDGPKRGRALRKPLAERVQAVPGRAVGGFAYREGFYKDKNGIPLKPGDRIRHGNAKKNEMYGEGVVIVRAGDQIEEAAGVGGIGRDGKVYLDYVWVQIPGEAGPRLWKARMIVKQPDNAGPEEAAPNAIADDKFAIPLMKPVVGKDKDKDLEEQIRRAMDAGDEVSFNYNGKTRYVKPVKIWKNPVNDNVNVTAIENGEIKNFTIGKMEYIADPEGAAVERPEVAPAPEAKAEVPKVAKDEMNEIVAPTFDAIDEKQIRDGIADIMNQVRLRRDFYSKKGGWEGKNNAGTIDNAEVAIKAFLSSFNVDNPAEWEIDALEKAARRIRRVGEGMEPLADALDNLKKILKDGKRRAVLDKAAPEVAEINLELGVNFDDLGNTEEVKKGFKFIADKLPKARNYRAAENLRKAREAIDNINEALDAGGQVDEIKDYYLDKAIRRLNIETENPVATILAEKLKALQKDLETQRQALIDKRLNMPLPELPPVENIDNAGFEKVLNEIIQRMPRKDNDPVVGIRFQLANYVLPRVKNGFIDIEDLPLPELDKAINDLRNVGGLDAKYSEFADILEKYKKDIDSRGGQDGAIGAEPVNKINPEEVANQRVAENANAFAANENVRKILADDLVVDNDPILQPFAEEIKEFFADAEPKALAKLSAPARQALNKFVAKTLKDPNNAALPSDPDERKAVEKNLANLAFQLREEKLAFAPNSNDLGVGSEILDMDMNEMKKFADFLLNNNIDRARLKIKGQKTGFDIIPLRGEDKGINTTYMLIHRETGRKFIVKNDTMIGERGADAEIAASKLARALNIAGAYQVVRHNKNKDVIITAFAGEMLDLDGDPERIGDTDFLSDHRKAAQQGAFVDIIGLAIMDAILVNGDRHRSNLLVGRLKNLDGVNDPDNLEGVQFIPIDHGLAAIIVKGRNESPDNYIEGASGNDTHRKAVNIAARLIDLVGVDVYKQINDMTIQQAVQALQRERGSDISDADLDLIISRLELLRGIDNSKWKQILKKR